MVYKYKDSYKISIPKKRGPKKLSKEERRWRRRNGRVANVAEDQAQRACAAAGIKFVRRGYPDLMLLSGDDEIIGFVEIKPEDRDLKMPQVRFKRFCKRNSIPFLKWCPADGPEVLTKFYKRALKQYISS